MTELTKLPNIGKTMEKRLANVQIYDAETLKAVGSKTAFLKLRMIEGDTCLSSLYGLEGAVQGIRWHNLSPEDKRDLKAFFDSVK